MRTNAEINTEIYNYGPALLERVCAEVTTHATAANSVAEQQANKEKLNRKIRELMEQVVFQPNMSHDDLWRVLWQRVVYAGTLAAKASTEINSMATLVPLFKSLDNYDEARFIFDAAEWKQFVQYWKTLYGKTNWLQHAKKAPKWNPADYFKKTTPEVWKLLIKDEVAYPGLKFSALSPKIEKYLDVARTLHSHRLAGNEPALHYYTEGHTFSAGHLTGVPWIEERKLLAKVRTKLTNDVGILTAMHTMMDLGLKTIKPDRVMTYLFSQLGWLQTLPSTFSREDVIDKYLNKNVVEEMTRRADVLAYSLNKAGHPKAHRLLDIWIVKYGQEPDPEWGLTVNLQNERQNIQDLFKEVKSTPSSEWNIDESTAELWWPGNTLTPLKIPRSRKPSQRASRRC
ncbi:hypothetical protein [Aquaspirillum soli]